ncbi:MAG: hypothetical protein ABII22_02860 [Candidatus Micrarchaeota archaeon]
MGTYTFVCENCNGKFVLGTLDSRDDRQTKAYLDKGKTREEILLGEKNDLEEAWKLQPPKEKIAFLVDPPAPYKCPHCSSIKTKLLRDNSKWCSSDYEKESWHRRVGCKKCGKEFNVGLYESCLEGYRLMEITDPKLAFKLFQKDRERRDNNEDIYLESMPDKCPHCGKDKDFVVLSNEIEMKTSLSTYNCDDCKKNFAAGIPYIYLKYYKLQGLNDVEAFEAYCKEMKDFGATVVHLMHAPSECPYCKSRRICER